MISIVVAVDQYGGFSNTENNKMPKWSKKSDLKFFKALTSNKTHEKNALVMGRKTFESIGRVLPDRTTIVVSKEKSLHKDVVTVQTPDAAIAYCKENRFDNIFVVGGKGIYDHFIDIADVIYCTYIINCKDEEYEKCDNKFPAISKHFAPIYTDFLTNEETNVIEGIVVTYIKQ